MQETYEDFIQNILDTRGRFACGDEYHERHHIVPKSCGGGNEQENLIDLYAREHFIAHKLLALENPDNNSLVYAWSCMAFPNTKDQKRYELTPEEYEEARIALSRAMTGKTMSDEAKAKMSKKTKERLQDKTKHPMYGTHRYGENNPFYGRRHTEESKKKMHDAAVGLYIGENNPMYGKHHTEETRNKMSQNHADFSNEKHPRSMAVYCIELNEIFWGATSAKKKYGISYSTISACCRHKEGYISAGKHPETKEKLHWLYTNEAIEKGYITQQDLDNYLNSLKEERK